MGRNGRKMPVSAAALVEMNKDVNTYVQGHFSDRLASAIRRCRNPVLVGLDPRAQQLPAGLVPSGSASRTDWAAVYARFCKLVVDIVAPLVPAVKPQAACFEQLAAPGMQAFARVIAYARRPGLLVVVDRQRN